MLKIALISSDEEITRTIIRFLTEKSEFHTPFLLPLSELLNAFTSFEERCAVRNSSDFCTFSVFNFASLEELLSVEGSPAFDMYVVDMDSYDSASESSIKEHFEHVIKTVDVKEILRPVALITKWRLDFFTDVLAEMFFRSKSIKSLFSKEDPLNLIASLRVAPYILKYNNPPVTLLINDITFLKEKWPENESWESFYSRKVKPNDCSRDSLITYRLDDFRRHLRWQATARLYRNKLQELHNILRNLAEVRLNDPKETGLES